MFKPFKYHEQEVSSQPVSWQHLFSVLPFILTNTEKLGWFFSSSNSAGIQLGNTRSCSASSCEDGEGQERERVNREEHSHCPWQALHQPHTEYAYTQRRILFSCSIFCQFFFFNYKNHIIPAKAGCAKLVFKNHHSVWLSSCRQASYWSISH